MNNDNEIINNDHQYKYLREIEIKLDNNNNGLNLIKPIFKEYKSKLGKFIYIILV